MSFSICSADDAVWRIVLGNNSIVAGIFWANLTQLHEGSSSLMSGHVGSLLNGDLVT